ncbi:Zn-dependent oxidoreductase [Mucilaginibacter sp. FT3.2]|uniref:Zn-dependent oxidoreductase n=1 Tax=Mucilaginibacter sp. FT3.2 TaxID=2723090 RepID=UPI00160A8EBF|nr:Zn-dependent oxidoreductase [Mucilaginibacter sp. FT3.2]MBB6232940.1 NADPH:quinone reductase-like Zn-dependent oxidoreductase [Mucilaginibacter sp. FT3.2]
MDELMKAIVLSDDILTIQNVTRPTTAEPGHLLVKMNSSAINSGDKFFLKHPTPPGAPKSLYDIKGVSGAGMVLQIGEGVPEEYLNKNVTFYRQLKFSESVVGSWSEYAHVPFLDCAILPEGADPEDYSGSMVNIITPFAFLKQIIGEGHKGIISTAGNSATGIALLGFCISHNFPLISIGRTDEGRKELESLGAKNIIVQSDPDFSEQLTDIAQTLNATAIFDGVGGDILNKILTLIPRSSVIYSYGYIGDAVPFAFHTSTLALKNIIIRPFSNLSTETVKNPENLAKALKEITKLLHMPHFKTKTGKRFRLEEINDALTYAGGNGKKAVLYHK